MNPKLFLLSLVASLACSPGFAQNAESVDPHVIVKNLYAAHDDEKSPFFQSDNRKLVDQYFTKSLGDLIWNDAVESKGEVGLLSFDPLYASQDPQITDFEIAETGWGGDKKFGPDNEAVVQVTFKDSGEEQMISFQFLLGKGNRWKITDIRYVNLDDTLLTDILSPEE